MDPATFLRNSFDKEESDLDNDEEQHKWFYNIYNIINKLDVMIDNCDDKNIDDLIKLINCRSEAVKITLLIFELSMRNSNDI